MSVWLAQNMDCNLFSWRVLHYLSVCNRYSDTPMAVTEYLGQTKGTVSQTLKVLEKKALLFKEPDKDDKRVMHLKLTEQGQAAVARQHPYTVVYSSQRSIIR